MQLTMLMCVLLLLLMLPSATASMADRVLVRQPYGRLMCDRYCQSVTGFVTSRYDMSQLSCTLERTHGGERYDDVQSSLKMEDNKYPADVESSMSDDNLPECRQCSDDNLPECRQYVRQGVIKNYICDKVEVSTCKRRFYRVHGEISRGDFEQVKKIISAGPQFANCRANLARTPIMVAVSVGKLDIFDYLWNVTCDLTAVDEEGNNVLHLACIHGMLPVVKRLVRCNKVAIDSKGHKDRTPLIISVMNTMAQIFIYLLDNGADLSLRDFENNTALHYACQNGDLSIVKKLLKHSYIDTRGAHGMTPVMFTASHDRKEVFDYLVAMGSNLTIRSHDNNTIVHWACQGKSLGILDVLLKDKIPSIHVDSRGYRGQTPFMIACKRTATMRVLRYLVEMGSDLTLVDEDGHTCLYFACLSGNFRSVRYIFSLDIHGLGSNDMVSENETCQMVAERTKKRRVLKALMKP